MKAEQWGMTQSVGLAVPHSTDLAVYVVFNPFVMSSTGSFIGIVMRQHGGDHASSFLVDNENFYRGRQVVGVSDYDRIFPAHCFFVIPCLLVHDLQSLVLKSLRLQGSPMFTQVGQKVLLNLQIRARLSTMYAAILSDFGTGR